MKKSAKKTIRIVLYITFTMFAIAYILPLILTLSNGKPAQYKQILIESPMYLNMFWNSTGITIAALAGGIVVSSVAAYAFTVLTFRFKEILFFIYVIVMLLPLQVTLMPNYIVADFLGIRDSYLAIILPGIFSPFGVFILRQQMKMLPFEYIEAAQIDGAGHFRIFGQIMLPLVKSGLAALCILTFIEYWNLVDQAVVFIRDADRQPMSLFLARLNTKQMGVSFAAASFYVFPALVTLLYGADFLKDGIRFSALKR